MKKLAGIILAGAVVFCAFSAAPREAKAAAWYNCQAVDVMELSNAGTPLLMVDCSNDYATGINATAVQVSSLTTAQASRFVAMANSAVLSGRKFRVYMSDTACPNKSNCRIATSWSLYIP